MTNDHKANFAMIVITIITIAIIIIAIFAYNYTNVFKKYNTYNLDTKEILSYSDTLTGVELVSVMNKIDNINRKNKDKYDTEKIIEENEELRKDRKDIKKEESNKKEQEQENYMKISVKILMPNEKYNPMLLSRAEKDKIDKEKEKEKKEKTEEKYVALDMENILKNGVTKFTELFGTSRFKREDIVYYGNSNSIKEITYIKDGEY